VHGFHSSPARISVTPHRAPGVTKARFPIWPAGRVLKSGSIYSSLRHTMAADSAALVRSRKGAHRDT